MSFDYKKAGVDVETGDALVDWLESKTQKQIHQDRIVSGIGGFASLFRMDFPEMKKPCIVTCTDGVGTKVKLASHFGVYETVAQDLVAMCVNDLICTGGMPLIFLDYYATGKLNLKYAQNFLEGLKKACEESLCAMVGGETAEMPGVYHDNDFDCAGFAVGVVDEEKALGPQKVKKGDVILGVESSGFHSNGYSLLRKVFESDLEKWKDTLLTPTTLYVKAALNVFAHCEVHAAAHITGGGIENIPRVLPKDFSFKLQPWEMPKAFREVQNRTKMTDDQMLKTLNCGVGFCFVLPANQVEEAKSRISHHQLNSFIIGSVE